MIGAPNFAQGDALMSPDSTLLISIQSGKGPMPAYRGVLSDQDILDVIAYLRTFN
jgi:mono/diheme cytochrome c family protein